MNFATIRTADKRTAKPAEAWRRALLEAGCAAETFKSAFICLLCLPPALCAASQCPPSDVCEVTARVLSVREGPADEEGISILHVRMRIRSVGRMVEKSRFSPPAQTCAEAYKKGMKVEINRLKGAGKGLKGSGDDPRAIEGFRPGAVLRGEMRYGCDEKMTWYDFENVVVLSLDSAGQRKSSAKPDDMCLGHQPGRPEVKVAGIYSCVNDAGRRVFEVAYAAEDTGWDYYGPERRHIARCAALSDEPPTKACSEMSAYSCDRERSVDPALCGRGDRVYLACGCGCCGGVEPLRQCLYHSKGDDPKKIIEEDLAAAKNPACAMAGCSRGIEYLWCD
ncbi:MAG: hypothetical protein HY553_05510 [Elusimicrobia bacterium]|nr:hypothetical protein [Elusimicrobiota bacterium]